MTLYELKTEYQELLDLLEDGDAEEQAVTDTLSMILADIEDKAEDYCKVMKQLQADAEALKVEKMRIAQKQSGIERNIDRMRGALLHTMLLTGKRKIKKPLFSISTSIRYKAFLDVPEDLIPKEFQKVTVKADSKAIEDWLKTGPNASECHWAHLEPVDSLTIR